MQDWKDGDWFVGRLPQAPRVFSQGATAEQLDENIRDAYLLLLQEQELAPVAALVHNKETEVLI